MYFVIDCRRNQFKILSVAYSLGDAQAHRNKALEFDGSEFSQVIITQAV